MTVFLQREPNMFLTQIFLSYRAVRGSEDILAELTRQIEVWGLCPFLRSVCESGTGTGRLSSFLRYWVNAVVPLNLSEPSSRADVQLQALKCYYWRYSQQQYGNEYHKPDVLKKNPIKIKPFFIVDNFPQSTEVFFYCGRLTENIEICQC